MSCEVNDFGMLLIEEEEEEEEEYVYAMEEVASVYCRAVSSSFN